MMKFNFSRNTVAICFAFFTVNFSLFAQNDNPCDAGVPVLSVGSTCVYTNSTNLNATETVGPTDPACAGIFGSSSPSLNNADVWFTTIVPASGSLKVTLRSGGMTDSGMALYSGASCNSLTFISCNDDISSSNFMSEISALSLTPGSTVWIRVWSSFAGTDGTFGICVKEIAAPPVMPNCGNNSLAGDECNSAPPICNLNGYCGNTSGSYTNSGSTWPGIETAFSCGGIQNDSYISFVASSSTITLYAWVTSGDPLLGVQMMIFSSPSCGSGTPISYNCIGQMQPSAIPYEVSASGLTVGRTYYLLIDGYSNDICDYVIGVPSIGGGLDLPVNVTPITATICAGSTISITATGGSGSYDWSTSPSASTLATTNTALVTTNVLPIGTYTYTVVSNSASTCPSNSTSIITVIAAPTETTGTPTVCIGTTTQLSNLTVGGVWSSIDPTIATVDATGLVTGVSAGPCTIRYVVCGLNKDLVVTVNAAPSIPPITGNLNICIGTNSPLSDLTTGGTWSSSLVNKATVDPSTGVVTGVAVGSSVITYTVNSGGCIVPITATVNITAIPVVPAIGGMSSVCVGSTITLNDAMSSGVWSSGTPASATIDPVTGVVTGQANGTTLITYTVSSNGCSANNTKTITVVDVLTPITGTLSLCVGGNTTLANATAGGVWSSGSTNIATIDPSTGVVTGVSNGTSLIKYTLCSIDIQTTVSVNALPIVDPITGINTICNGSPTTFSSITAGGVWTSGNLSCATIDPTTGVVSTVGVGTSLITYTVTANGCSTPETITLNVNAMPVVQPITGLDKVCVGSTITMLEQTVAGTWISSSPVNATIDAASGIVTGVFTGQTAITYSKTVLGCTTTSPAVIVDVNPLPIVSPITGNSSFCIFSSLDLADLTPGGIWSSSSLGIATVDIATGKVAGVSGGVSVITYTVTNQVSGCTDKQTKTITVVDQPKISINYSVLADNKTCLFQVPDTLFLDQNTGGGLAAGNWTYELPKTTATANVLAPTSLNTGIIVSDYGIYKFTYTEPTCNDEATIILNVTPQVYGKLETYYPLCKDASLELTVVDISHPEYLESLVWNTGATTNSITVSEGGTYTATLRNVCNPDGLVLPSLVDIKICDIDMPNVFTPNGDGVNDVYHINGEKDIFKEFNIVIVNRWGNVIVSYNDPKGTWDGKNSSNQFVDEGVYFYTVKAVTLQGKELVKQGFVHVVDEK